MNPGLYVTATPIGRMLDITFSAVEALKAADLILCEDTRVTSKLLNFFEIKNHCETLNKFNEASQVENLLTRVRKGQAIVLVSDAGTPAIHDPGFRLVAAMQANNLPVFLNPGASSLVAALSVAGCLADKFMFKGFLPSKTLEKQAMLKTINDTPETVVCFESPHRIEATLNMISDLIIDQRQIVCCRELTKLYETIKVLQVSEIKSWLFESNPVLKGEWVLVFRCFQLKQKSPSDNACAIIDNLVPVLGISQATRIAKNITSEPKKALYDYALKKYG